jgi:hypothetical protein
MLLSFRDADIAIAMVVEYSVMEKYSTAQVYS